MAKSVFCNTDCIFTWDAPFDPSRSINISDQDYLKILCPQRASSTNCGHEFDIVPIQCPCGAGTSTFACKREHCKIIACDSCSNSKGFGEFKSPVNQKLLPAAVKIRDDGMFVPNQLDKDDKAKIRKYIKKTLKNYDARHKYDSKNHDIQIRDEDAELVDNSPQTILTEHIGKTREPVSLLQNHSIDSSSYDRKEVRHVSKHEGSNSEKLRKKLDKSSVEFSQSRITLRQAIQGREALERLQL